MKKKLSIVNIKNKKAFFDYEILEEYIAGIELKGSEVKSIRLSRANICESFCYIKNEEIFIKNMHISKYEFDSQKFFDEKREKKLLLKKKEIKKLIKNNDNGKTIVPLSVFFSKKGFCKIKIALARGKKDYDKRKGIKEKDVERVLRRTGNFKF